MEAEPCHADKAMKSCPFHQKEAPEKKGCCHDESEYFKLEQEQQFELVSFELPDHTGPLALPSTLIIDLPQIDKKNLHYLNYKPPLLVCDLPLRLQTFLC